MIQEALGDEGNKHTLHIANLFFEEELLGRNCLGLKENILLNKHFRDLHYLPLLYGKRGECFLIAEPMSLSTSCKNSPEPVLIDDLFRFQARFQGWHIEPWGHSDLLMQLAKKLGLVYTAPPSAVVKKVHSKAWVIQEGFSLPGSALFSNREDALHWIATTPGPKVLKATIGLSGKGHLLIEGEFSKKRLDQFLDREFNENRLVIGEPWVERLFDFSTQWLITTTESHYLGSTLLYNSRKGVYQGTLAGEDDKLFKDNIHYLKQHLEIAQELVKKIAHLGFFGNLGIDAFVYGDGHLRPIVEINARKTMGYVALMLQRKEAPSKKLLLHYGKKAPELLLEGVLAKQNVQPLCGPNLRFKTID